MNSDRAEGNRFVAAWPDAVFRRLAPQLKPITLRHGMVLANGGPTVEHIYFPDRGMISLVKTMRDGRTAEVGIVGTEGMAGVGAVLGMRRATFEAVVQVDGYGQRLETPVLQAEVDRSHALKALTMRYLAYRVTQLAQTAACNRLHTLRQRCCRWLLTADDSVQATTFTLTHEFLALMMGVNRPSVSLVAAGLQRRGMIRYQRAAITIVDRPALERAACECYVSLKLEADRVYQP